MIPKLHCLRLKSKTNISFSSRTQTVTYMGIGNALFRNPRKCDVGGIEIEDKEAIDSIVI